MKTLLYISGAIFVIFGALLLFMSQKLKPEASEVSYLYTSEEADEIRKKEEMRRHKNRKLRIWALAFTICGIGLTVSASLL